MNITDYKVGDVISVRDNRNELTVTDVCSDRILTNGGYFYKSDVYKITLLERKKPPAPPNGTVWRGRSGDDYVWVKTERKGILAVNIDSGDVTPGIRQNVLDNEMDRWEV